VVYLLNARPAKIRRPPLFWHEEILQVMFWLRGEGLGERVNWPLLERFLDVDASIGIRYVERLVDEGYLAEQDGWFVLTEKGAEEGKRIFGEEFADITRPAHGECGPDCWCHASTEEAEACLAERAAHS
jgi:hypothetical protein